MNKIHQLVLWSRSKLGTLREMAIALIVGLSIAVLIVVLWLTLRAQENTHIQRSIAAHAQQLQTVVKDSMESHIRALVRMANRWEVDRKPPKQEWLADATLYIEHEPDYHAIAWVDTDLQVRWIFPVQGNQDMLNHNLGVEERHAITLSAARTKRQVQLTRSVEVGQDNKGFAVYVPIFLGDASGGFIGGLFHIQALFDTLLRDSSVQGYALAVFDGDEEIYTRTQAGQQYRQAWIHEVPITLHNITWRMRVLPSAALLAGKQSALPDVVLVGGLLFAILVSLLLELMRTARLRAHTIIQANQDLHSEIGSRRQVELELRGHREHLEELVQERTSELSTSNTRLSQEIVQREEAQHQLRQLTDHLLSIREEEGARIAREIHDELGQAMMALNMDVYWLSDRIPKDQPQLKAKSQEILDLIATTIEAIRRIASNLRPSLLDDLGLEAAIHWYLEQFEKRSGIECEPSINVGDALFTDPCSTVVFRIFQEALTNISRHAEATKVRVDLQVEKDALILSVKDNGKGISKKEIQQGGGFGLLGIRERAQSIKGTVEISGRPGQGTLVKLHIPGLHKKCTMVADGSNMNEESEADMVRAKVLP